MHFPSPPLQSFAVFANDAWVVQECYLIIYFTFRTNLDHKGGCQPSRKCNALLIGACVATCVNVICSSVTGTCELGSWLNMSCCGGNNSPSFAVVKLYHAATKDTQHVTNVNRFLIALAAVQITKTIKEKNHQQITFQLSERSPFLSSLSLWKRVKQGHSVFSDLRTVCGSGGCLRRRSGAQWFLRLYSFINCFFFELLSCCISVFQRSRAVSL